MADLANKYKSEGHIKLDLTVTQIKRIVCTRYFNLADTIKREDLGYKKITEPEKFDLELLAKRKLA